MKLYDKYEVTEVFGVISRPGNVVLLKFEDERNRNYALCPGLESVYLWDLRLGELKNVYVDKDSLVAEVRCLCVHPDQKNFSAGYSDGSIRMWKIEDSSSPNIIFNGHRSGITCLEFGKKGSIMAAGSMDTNITIWDVAMEKGLYKLKGHKNQVTGVKFLEKDGWNYLISCGKDSLIKIWDLFTQHCIETLINPSGNVHSLAVEPVEEELFFSAAATSVCVWRLDRERMKILSSREVDIQNLDVSTSNTKILDTQNRAAKVLGNLERYKAGTVLIVKVSSCGNYVFLSGKDRKIDVFKILTRTELEKRAKKNRKRKRNVSEIRESALQINTLITRVCNMTLPQRVLSFDITSVNKIINILVNTIKNQLNYIELKPENPAGEMYTTVSAITLPGHRLPPRVVCLGNDDNIMASCSADETKIWNISSKLCIKTIKTEQTCVCEFINNDEYVILGTKDGSLNFINTKSSDVSIFSNAHTAQISSLQLLPGANVIMTASKDKTVKFWELSKHDHKEHSQMGLLPTLRKTLSLTEEVSCAKISPNGKLLAVALLDCTVKVFFTDTFKLFLSLYGHKLPITSIDISSDTSIVATASLDKTVKIWGLDFGDCRKSFLAHDEVVTECKFIYGTHHLFSVGKDRMLKYWDAEKLELISKLPSHHGEIWALTPSKYGDFVITGSDDMSIRIWRKTDDRFALHEERRAELDRLYQEEIKSSRMAFSGLVGQEAEKYDYREQLDESHEVESIVKSENDQIPEGNEIIDALTIYETDRAIMDEYHTSKKTNPNTPTPARNPFVLSLGDPLIAPELYVLSRLEKLRPSTLENSLIILPYMKILNLLNCIDFWSKGQRSIALVARTLLFLLNLNHHQISTSPTHLPLIMSIRKNLSERLIHQRNLIGLNISFLSFITEALETPRVPLIEE